MKATRVYLIAALLAGSITFASEAAAAQQVPPPPPRPPDPLHLFKGHPRRPVLHRGRRIHIKLPHIKLPPPPPRP